MTLNAPFVIEEQRDSLSRKKRYRELYKTYFNNPEIKNRNTSALWNDLNNTFTTNPMVNDRISIVSRQIYGKEINVLNIGVGTGNLEKQVLYKKNKGYISWTGIDLSRDSVRNASKMFRGVFKKGDIVSYYLKKEMYDFVIMLEVLEHISPSNTFIVLKKIQKSLKKGGKFIVSVPLNEGLKEMVLRGINPNQHVRVYTKSLLDAELSISGFSVRNHWRLYAFGSLYHLKTFIVKKIYSNAKKPNNLIVLAQKKNNKEKLRTL